MPAKLLALRRGDKANFRTLLKAAKADDVCLLSTIRKEDRAKVALVCAVNRDPSFGGEFVPLAVMIEGNPYDLFEPPCPSDPPSPSTPANS